MTTLNLPPIHPALVHFPIALTTLSFVFDLCGRMLHRRSLYSAGWWTLVASVVTTIAAIPLGYFDFSRAELSEGTRLLVETHVRIGWLLLGVLLLLGGWRWLIRRQPDRGPEGRYLSVAALVMIIALFQGWYGGEMVYSHGAGVAAADQGTQPMIQAQRPLEKVNSALSRIPGFASAGAATNVNEAAGSERKK
jgi:uncharacterized membrane protein